MNVLDRAHWALLSQIARSGSLGAAASALNITQPAASQRLREAERRLGVALAVRRGRGLQLTEAGRLLAEAGLEAVPQLRAAETEAIWQGKRSARLLRVAWTEFDPLDLGAALDTALAALPDPRQAEFVRLGLDETAEALRSGRIDAALLPKPPRDVDFASVPVCADGLVGIERLGRSDPAPEPADPESFDGRTFVSYGVQPEPGQEYETFFEGGHRFGATLRTAGSTELICHMVADGRADTTILPKLCARLSAAQDRLRCFPLEGFEGALEWRVYFAGGRERAWPAALAAELAARFRQNGYV